MRRWQIGLFVVCMAVTCRDQGRPVAAGPLRRSNDPWARAPASKPHSSAGDRAARSETCALDDARENRVTVRRLLADMVDLARLSELPSPPYVSRMASSHNRRSDRARPGSKRWYANKDHISLAAGETRTLVDVQGPGALTRIWSASPAGVLRIYLDGAGTPIVEAELAELLSGQVRPFSAPFAFVAEGGHNLYFPMPFARSCKVTLTGEANEVFFHVGYRAYEPGAEVETLDRETLRAAACVRSLVAGRLSALGSGTEAVEHGRRTRGQLSSRDPNSRIAIEAGPRGGVLWQLRVTPSATSAEALRSTVLSITFDGLETVRAPLGDFFGTAFGLHRVSSLPLGVHPHGVMTSRWPMPFRERAVLALQATGALKITAKVEVVSAEHVWTERSLLFHAQWHAPETFPSSPSRDWNLATITGEGLYVGNVLNVVNRNRHWWGEGDEKVHVDGESFPGHFGTGTEDYYGYAWCSNQPFTTAFVGHPLSTPRQNFGALSLYRFHVPDPIAFRRELRFDLEVRHWGRPVAVTYDALSFWYARPGSELKGAARDPAAFRVPEVGVREPQYVPVAPYHCGE